MKILADWLGWWIETHCACGHMALVPVRMLVDQLDSEYLIVDNTINRLVGLVRRWPCHDRVSDSSLTRNGPFCSGLASV